MNNNFPHTGYEHRSIVGMCQITYVPYQVYQDDANCSRSIHLQKCSDSEHHSFDQYENNKKIETATENFIHAQDDM